MKRKLQFVSALFLLLSLLCIIRAVYNYSAWESFKKEHEKTTGVILKNKVDKDRYFYPVIRFKTYDNQYSTFTGTQRSRQKYREGDTVQVYYDLANPDDAYTGGHEDLGIKTFGWLSVIFGMVGGSLLLLILSHQRYRNQLIRNGKKVSATIVAVEERQLAGLPLFVIHCQWQNQLVPNAATHQFYSSLLWDDPSPYLSSAQINVYMDINQEKKYYVDTSALPASVLIF